ncbi:PRX-14 protein, partial [Aphelenchoides avenae]
MDAPSTAASSTSAEAAPPPAAANRPEMVEAARQFFMNPKVRATPFEEQRKFLREKGCTEAEMDEALDGISPVEVAAMSSATQYSPGPEVQYARGGGNRLMTFTQSAMIVGGASYVAYKFVRSWLLPKFFDIPDPAQEQVNQLSAQ